MWDILRRNNSYPVHDVYVCPNCDSKFRDSYGTEVETTYYRESKNEADWCEHRFRCPVCEINVVYKEILQ